MNRRDFIRIGTIGSGASVRTPRDRLAWTIKTAAAASGWFFRSGTVALVAAAAYVTFIVLPRATKVPAAGS